MSPMLMSVIGWRSPANLVAVYGLRAIDRDRRASGKVVHECVADIAKVRNADLAGKKTVSGQIAEKRDEDNALSKLGGMFGALAISDQVEDLFLLLRCATEIRIAVTVGADRVEPHQSTAELQLVFGVLACEQIDEFGGTGLNGASGICIGGDDRLAQFLEQFILRGRKELRCVCAGFVLSFFSGDLAVDEFSRSQWSGTQGGGCDGSHAQ